MQEYKIAIIVTAFQQVMCTRRATVDVHCPEARRRAKGERGEK